MAPNPNIMRAVEQLGYRVTVGDVASQAGLEVRVAEKELLALASEAGGHLQVAESGEIAYQFQRNFRDVLRNKYFRMRVQEWWNRVWKILFYLIRISFGIVLIASIVLLSIAILAIVIAANSRSDGDSNGGEIRMPTVWFGDVFWIFTPDYRDDRAYHRRQRNQDREMNFLEAVFSFLFGDGNPNADLDERRWKAIGTVIRSNGGSVIAEQVAPYLDDLGSRSQQEYEDYMLPVLSRFNGRPEVSPEGQLVYHFPELQVTANQKRSNPVAAYLKELSYRFSQATSGQIILAAGLGGVNIVLALVLGSLLADGTIAAQLGGLVAFVAGIYWGLLAYGIGFLAIPLIRYFWIQGRNRRIESRNDQRQQRAMLLNQKNPELQQKLLYARQFAATMVVDEKDLAYTTETDLTEQELLRSDKVDEEWQRRLESGL
jgi:hypothetical protein